MLLNVENLKAEVAEDGKQILKGLNLQVNPGEVHAIMGPNGAGKSTFSSVLAGREDYEVTEGSVDFDGEDLLEMDAEERARKGLFLAFQYPVEIPGVSNKLFMQTALNAIREEKGLPALDMFDFDEYVQEKMELMGMRKDMLERSVNVGFSGGEKKRNDIFQMALLEPKLCIMDETDSGLDIDALKVVANGVNSLRDPNRSFIVVTHYQRLLDYIKPDFVHVLYDGKIVKSGGFELVHELEDQGYDSIIQSHEAQLAG
ncbi:Fe-S cluster assembly ATPase SufC [Hydrogenovibrio marinus]|jgi:Fe-S cluster assembly ATP-binding protein|uniref:Cysteine desulfurase n=1 Tax=Hydrogenovibrio marinus TaxID=28885 RepID=A0A066ZSS7_HYDMR|nr:Fe-S cluster assembly ATPase SufC [Hydrogenovibrio marinus]KDN96863.1 cysteine desulfurase [Hydrogenovibrio marinus]MBD3822232.1 Fe-S cluster assembly ATPase SufC [Thiotrichales bacterium]BBN59122.1 ABC transporter ATP-binding protein [Hydrogenovibrio marinus]